VAARLLQVVVFPCRGCSLTAVTRVQIPSGTPSLFTEMRVIAEMFVGTKRTLLNNTGCFPRLSGATMRARRYGMAVSTITDVL
jgi:hypothetical protein